MSEVAVSIKKCFRPIFTDDYRYLIYKGGRGCVDGETLIDTPNGQLKIKDFTGGLIYSFDGRKLIVSVACSPIRYTKEKLYEVKTPNSSIIVTDEHRFLTADGWKMVKELIAKPSLVYIIEYSLPLTNSDVCPLTFDGDVQHYFRTILGWLYRCWQDYHQYDEQLLTEVKTYQDVLPLLAYGLRHSCHASSRSGGSDTSYICDLTYQFYSHLYNSVFHQESVGKNCEDKGSYNGGKFSGLLLEFCRQVQRFREYNNHLLLAQELSEQFLALLSFPKSEQILEIISDTLTACVDDTSLSDTFHNCNLFHHNIKAVGVSINYVKEDYYYDMFVPFYNNYLSNGIINHNSGKSWGIADSLIMVSRMKKARILCTREVQSSISASSYQLLVDRIKHYGFLDFEITKTEIINKITGSSFIFKGLSESSGTNQSVKSIEGITHAWIEEAQTVSTESWKILTPSIRADNAKIIISYNPDSENDPVHQEFIVSPKPRSFIHHINYTDNKYCPQVLIDEAEEMKKNKPDEYENIWLGQIKDKSKTAVVKYFSKENIDDKITYCPDLPIYLSMDFNVDPMMWVVSHKTSEKIFVFDEIVLENVTTQDAINEFIERYQNHKAKIVLNGDASGNYRKTQSKYSDYAIINNALVKAGFKVEIDLRKFNPPIKHRIHAFNQLVLGDDGLRRWFCHSKCRWLIYNLNNLRYIEGTSKLDLPNFNQVKQSRESKFMGHIFDAVSYQVEYYFPVIKELT